MSIPSSILALADQTDDLRERLVTWAEINSGSDHAAGLDRMADVLETALLELTPLVDRVPAGPRHTIRARARPDAPVRVLCSGHYDTVYGADHPFQTCRQLGSSRLNGPGVADMKGGIVTMLAALRAFEGTPRASDVGWEVLLTPDEEIGSQASAPAIEAAAKGATFGLVFEPARPGGEIVRSRMGTGAFLITCHGRSAHGAQPEAGRNAILALSRFLLAADQIPVEHPEVLVNAGRIRGGGAINIVPDHAEAELHIRITAAHQQAAVQDRLHALAAAASAETECELVVTGSFDRPPKECLPAEVSAYAAWRAVAADLGQTPPDWIHTGGGSDGNLLSAAGLACLDGVGPIGAELHSRDEWVDLSSLTARAQVAALFLHRVAIGQIVLGESHATAASSP